MASTRAFRFGVIVERALGPGWREQARRVEDAGYDTFLLRDHLLPDVFGDQVAPLPALAAVAAVTSRLRVGTLVLCNDFRHPAVLAREAATLDVLSGGRFELGIGAGWLRTEYAAAGIPFDAAGERLDRLDEALAVIGGLLGERPLSFAGGHYRIDGLDGFPKPQQRPRPPLLVGGGKRRALTLAGRHADIVSLMTTSVASGALVDDASERSPAALEQKLAWVREGAGERFGAIELNTIPTLVLAGDRERAAEELARSRGWRGVSGRDVLAMPAVLIGSHEQIAEQMLARRERFGLSYYTVSDGAMDDFAPVVRRLAGQ